MATFKTSKKDKEWFAEQCGRHFVKLIHENIEKVYNAAMEKHGFKATSENKQIILQAYRTSNPRCKSSYAAKTYDEFYDKGSQSFSASNAEIGQFLVASGIDKERRLQEVREAIIASMLSKGISALDSKLIDVFKYGVNLNELLEARNQIGSDGRDQGDELGQFDAAAQLALPRPGSEEDGE